MEIRIVPESLICGYFDCSIFKGLKQSPKRIRTCYELEYYLEDGRLTYSDGVPSPIKRGYIRIGVPGEECYSLLPFKTKYVKFCAEGDLAAMMEGLPKLFRALRPLQIEELLDGVIRAAGGDEPDGMLLAGRLMLLLCAVRDDAAGAVAVGGETVLRAKHFVEENLASPIRLADVAAEVSLSPNYFHTLFRDSEGVTLGSYICDRRLMLAGELLRTTDLPLSQIAERCGFCNQQYMAQLFKKKYGTTPLAYRKTAGEGYLR